LRRLALRDEAGCGGAVRASAAISSGKSRARVSVRARVRGRVRVRGRGRLRVGVECRGRSGLGLGLGEEPTQLLEGRVDDLLVGLLEPVAIRTWSGRGFGLGLG